MKHKRIIALLLALCLAAACFGCNNSDGSKDATTEAPTTPAPVTEAPTTAEPTTEEPGEPDAETAMNNFLAKLTIANYVIAPEKQVKTTVYSPEQVTFINGEGSSSDNYAIITYNGETFVGTIYKDQIVDISFLSRKNAVDSVKYTLPNSWITACDGNIWDLFYNNVDDPLEFTTNSDVVKRTLLSLGGYVESVLELTEEVHMQLDAEDPKTARFTAHVKPPENKMYHYDDVDITIEFGIASSDPRVDAWLSNPVYPGTKTAWTREDIATLDQVFNRGYGAPTVPFPDFASYALIFDEDAYAARSEIYLSDGHATEQNVKDYAKTLLDNGFTAVEDTQGGETVTIYRKLLREEYNAYADLYPYYEDGFVLRGGMYYEDPEYNGLEEINELLVNNGFAALPETDIFGEWKAQDHSRSQSEGWLYFFDYNLYMPMMLNYQDLDAAKAYFEDYGKKLEEIGLIHTYAPGDNSKEYRSANDFIIFRWTVSEDAETIKVEFKNEKSLTAEEVRSRLKEHNLPETNVQGDIGARDQTRYHYNVADFEGLFLTVYQPFESSSEAEAFLDAYVAGLDEQDYIYTNPRNVGSNRAFLYWNAEARKYVAFDYFMTAKGATIFFEFVSIESELEQTPLQKLLHR